MAESLRGGPPLEPSQEAKAAFKREYHRDWFLADALTQALRAAYAIDGLRAVPSQESGPEIEQLREDEARIEWLDSQGWGEMLASYNLPPHIVSLRDAVDHAMLLEDAP